MIQIVMFRYFFAVQTVLGYDLFVISFELLDGWSQSQPDPL